MPLSLVIAQVFIVETVFPAVLPVALLIASGVITALAASFYSDFMMNSKSSRIAAHIRGGIIMLVFFYILASLLHGGISWKERFIPNLSNVPVSVASLFVWTSVISLKQIFSARKRFEDYTKMYQGDQLKQVLFDDSGLLQYNDETIVKTRRNYLFQLILTGILAIIAIFIKTALSLPLYIFLLAILAGGICIFGFFGIIRWEQYYAGEGICLSPRDRSKRILGMVMFALFSLAAALLLASDKSILSFSLITGFFAWFFGLFRRTSSPIEGFVETETSEPQDISTPFLFLTEESDSVSIWLRLLRYGIIILKYGVIIFLIGGFILFMISPLLNRGKTSADRPSFFRRLIHIITALFNGIANVFVSFFAHLKSGKPMNKIPKHGAKEIRQTAETILGAYSQAKRQGMRQSVTLFARLIIWGSEVRQIVWKPVYAPGEYCGILAAAEDTPDNEGIIRCGELFEQSLYSAEVLSDVERKEFKDLIEKITA
jgi:hypothetical protein